MTLMSKPLSPAVAGASLMVLAGALFAVVNIVVQHIVMIEQLPPARVAFWQYAIALAVSIPWVATRAPSAVKTGVLAQHILRVVLAAVGVRLWIMGLAYVPIWQAIALIMLSPFFVTLGAAILLGEHVTRRRWGAVSMGFVGGMIILAPWSDAFTYKALLPIGAAVFWAASTLLTKRMTATESAETLTLYLLLFLTPVNALLAAGDGLAFTIGPEGALMVLAGGLTALAQYALVSAYRRADASFLQPFDHVKLPLNVLLGVLAFGFVPPGMMWLGSALIVFGSLYLVWSERENDPV